MCGGGSKPPAAYTPKWQSGADSTLSGNLGSQSSQASGISNYALPQLQTQTSNVINDPNQASAMATAGSASTMGQAAGQQQMGQAQNLYNLSSSLTPMAQQIYQTAFDPQGALYAQQLQQSQDAQNAMAAMYGVASSPYGAGLAAQNTNNFNIDWQNAQLGRQVQGAGAIQGLDSLSGSLAGQGAQLQNVGLNTYTQAGMLPYQTSQGIYGNNLSALGGYTGAASQALSPGYSADSQLGNYLSLGQNATSINDARSAQLNAMQAAQMQGIGSTIGNLFGNGIGSSFSNLFGGGQMGAFSPQSYGGGGSLPVSVSNPYGSVSAQPIDLSGFSQSIPFIPG